MNAHGRTVVLLIRHAQTDDVGMRLAGRTDGAGLNQSGRSQAERLCTRLAGTDIAAIYSSPLQRAIETAGPLARERDLPVEPHMGLLEIDFGDWTGAHLEHLAADQQWMRFNRYRSMTPVPGGERAVDAQARIVRALDECRTQHPGQTVAFVTHGDLIRLAVLYVGGVPVDFIHRFDVAPASLTAVALDDDSATVLYVNERDPIGGTS
jgi:broad specificity phosphatase PhoE